MLNLFKPIETNTRRHFLVLDRTMKLAAVLATFLILSALTVRHPAAEALAGHVSHGLTIASVWFQTVDAPPVMPPRPYEYRIMTVSGDPVKIEVVKNDETGHASVVINRREVMKFRTPLEGMTPYGRASRSAERLNRFLAAGGDPSEIQMNRSEKETAIVVGNEPLIVIDRKTARASGQKPRKLGQIWTNYIRRALKTEPYFDPVLAAHMAQRYKFPLMETYYMSTGQLLKGEASWYGPGFHGRIAADGSVYNMNELTAAHKTLPFGTVVRVTNHRTGKQVLVRITDRGPYIDGRIIDLSKEAANRLGMLSSGTAPVTVEILAPKTTS